MMEYLEEALDFYLGGKRVSRFPVEGVKVPLLDSEREGTPDSKPELKLWRVEP